MAQAQAPETTHGAVRTVINENATDAETRLSDLENIPQAACTGIISGGAVTINGGDNTTIDIAAGTGVVIDWTTPTAPVRTPVSWSQQLAVTMPNLSTGIFTTLSIDSSGVLAKISGSLITNQARRLKIYLQTAIHTSGTQIDSISNSSEQAYQVVEALRDYVIALGSVNTGNQYTANGANLNINKSSGTTTLPFINRNVDPQNPSALPNAQESALSFTYTYQDGSSSWLFVPSTTAIDPDLYDDGSGTLQTVSNNKWTIKKIYYFAQSDATTITYGQIEYSSEQDAIDAIQIEEVVINPFLTSGALTTVLVVKKGETDLTNANNSFVSVNSKLR